MSIVRIIIALLLIVGTIVAQQPAAQPTPVPPILETSEVE